MASLSAADAWLVQPSWRAIQRDSKAGVLTGELMPVTATRDRTAAHDAARLRAGVKRHAAIFCELRKAISKSETAVRSH
jgi:hypothetical protein